MDSYMQGSFDANHGNGFHIGLAERKLEYLKGYVVNKFRFSSTAGRGDLDIASGLLETFRKPELRDYALALVMKPIAYAFWRVANGPIDDPSERRTQTRETWRFLNVGEIAREIKSERLSPRNSSSRV